MACTTTSATFTIAFPALADGRSVTALHYIGLPPLPVSPHSVASLSRTQVRESWKPTTYCRKIARNVVARATGEASAEVATELPEIVKTIQDAWDKVEDKYAVSSIAVAGVIALWGSTGMISAIDRLPVVPGVLELVGIGYTGWFAYRNLVFKPDRVVGHMLHLFLQNMLGLILLFSHISFGSLCCGCSIVLPLLSVIALTCSSGLVTVLLGKL